MKTILQIVFLLLAISFGVISYGQSPNDSLFNNATNLYNEGRYNEAINNYKQILESKHHSAALYFNLGNAYYKLNKVGLSIYYYEKALLQEPGDLDILNNLSYAQKMTLDAIEPLPPDILKNIGAKTVSVLSYENWSVLAILFVLLFVAAYLIYYFSFKSRIKRLAFIISFSSIFLALMALIFAYLQKKHEDDYRPAIIFAEEAGIKSEPNLRSEKLFDLHEGTKVEIIDTLATWKKVKLADGKTGWVLQEDLKELKSGI